jgi:hypothetical protein
MGMYFRAIVVVRPDKGKLHSPSPSAAAQKITLLHYLKSILIKDKSHLSTSGLKINTLKPVDNPTGIP